MTALLELRGLGKDYGARRAVGAIDLSVIEGEIFGLLGPNGAGKTTTISMACGVITPTRGTAVVAGHDLAVAPRQARAAIGLVPQDLAIYEAMTAVENLRFFGSLYGLGGARLRDRIAWVLDVAGLTDRAGEPTHRFSGGMKRRLNLAAGLLHRPRLLVLDEPTVGVDPQSRNHIFASIRALRAEGMTIVYTSHYMEEVEALCDRVAIMDRGAIALQGDVRALLAERGAGVLELTLAGDEPALAAAAAAAAAHGAVERTGARIAIAAPGALGPIVSAVEAAGARIVDVQTHRPSLETVFLELTGHSLRD